MISAIIAYSIRNRFLILLLTAIVTALTRAPVKLGFDRKRARDFNWLFTNRRIPPHPTGQHVQDQYFEFLADLGVPWEPVTWNLGPWPGEESIDAEFYAKIDRPIATIVVATSKPVKDWPAERWAEVVDVLYEQYGLQPVLAGGDTPADHRAVEVIRRLARHKPVEKIGDRPALGGGALLEFRHQRRPHLAADDEQPHSRAERVKRADFEREPPSAAFKGERDDDGRAEREYGGERPLESDEVLARKFHDIVDEVGGRLQPDLDLRRQLDAGGVQHRLLQGASGSMRASLAASALRRS